MKPYVPGPSEPPIGGVFGSRGDDILNGTREDDTISGLGGDDEIHGYGGADWLNGSEGTIRDACLERRGERGRHRRAGHPPCDSRAESIRSPRS